MATITTQKQQPQKPNVIFRDTSHHREESSGTMTFMASNGMRVTISGGRGWRDIHGRPCMVL